MVKDPKEEGFEKKVGKEYGYQYFLLFPLCFLPFLEANINFFGNILIAICKCLRFRQAQNFAIW